MRWFIVLVLILSVTTVLAEENTTEVGVEESEEGIVEEEVIEDEAVVEEVVVGDIVEEETIDNETSEEGDGLWFFIKIGEFFENNTVTLVLLLVILVLCLGAYQKRDLILLQVIKLKAKHSSKKAVVGEEKIKKSSEEKKQELETLKEELVECYPKVLKEDVKKVLKTTDQLLGEMPDEQIYEFVHSEEFGEYKKVMKKVYDPVAENKNAVEKLDKVLNLYQKDVIDISEARKMLGLPIRTVNPRSVGKKTKEEVLKTLKKQKEHEEN
jgi:hypothetical protein